MTHARFSLPTLAIVLAFSICACEKPRAEVNVLPQPSYARVFEYPLDGVDLGQGWHHEQAVKAVATCIDFKPLADTGQEQTMQVSVVTDRSDLMDQLDVSAEVQVKSIAYSVSGKAHYAQAAEIKAESLNVVAHARVENAVEYVAPAEVSGLKRIDLTPHYRDLVGRDPAAFERECGDGFVSAIHGGAELTAILAFTEQSSTKRKAIEASMKGSGWGFSASGGASKKMDEYGASSNLRISYYQTGGQGNPIPTDQAGFLEAIKELPRLAAQDGVSYRIRVQSYRSLPSYPFVEAREDTFRRELALSYGRLASLRDDIAEILQSPRDEYVDFRPDTLVRLRALNDEVTTKLRKMKEFAARCSFLDDGAPKELSDQCRLSADLRQGNDYEYRLRLPARAVVTRSDAYKDKITADEITADEVRAGRITADEIKDAIIEQHVRSVSRERCARDIDDPGCLLESEIATLRASLDRMAPVAPAFLR